MIHAMSATSHAPEIGRGDLQVPEELSRGHLRGRLLAVAAVIAVVVAVITLVPGLASLRARFAHARAEWLVLGAALKVLSGLSYVAIFRAVFCRSMPWRTSAQIGLAELGANALLPTGGAGGLALGAWALRRGGMEPERIARRSVAFFLLTSVPNVVGVIILGLGLAVGLFPGRAGLALSVVPVVAALGAISLALASGRLAAAASERVALRRGPSSRLPRVLGAVGDGVRESLVLLREHNLWLVLGGVGYLAFDVMILWATFRSFGTAPPLAIVWIGYLIGELGGLLPIPGGIGGVDLGLVGTLVLYHVPVASATAAVLAYRALALWVPAVLGSIAFVLLRRSLSHEAATVAGCPAGTELDVIGRGRVRVSNDGQGQRAGRAPFGVRR
jgi:uncharacterized membrane protein YbhN (UPF0104 family)